MLFVPSPTLPVDVVDQVQFAIPMSPIDLITPEATTQAQPEVIDLVTPPRAKPEEVGVVNFGFSSGGGAVEIDGTCTSIT